MITLITIGSFLLFTLLTAGLLLKLAPAPTPEPAGAEGSGLIQLPRVKPSDNASLVARFDTWFDRMVHFSGLGMTSTRVMLGSVLAAVTVGAVIFLLMDDFLKTAGAAAVVWTLCLAGVYLLGQRRLRQFEDQLPDAMNLLSKAVRAGASFEQSVKIVGESSPDPLGIEFRRCGGQLEMGLPVATAMRSLCQRVGSFDMQVFASTVAIHRQAGGNLSDTLERLASVIRQRINYRRQMRSVTGAGRISALVISLMAPIIFIYLFLFQPEYGQRLWDDPLGKMMIVMAFVTQGVGILWVKYILRSEY